MEIAVLLQALLIGFLLIRTGQIVSRLLLLRDIIAQMAERLCEVEQILTIEEPDDGEEVQKTD